MLTYIHGNIFDSKSQTIVNTVNTVGVMGKGIALEFKKRYPDMFLSYQKVCKTGHFHTGMLQLYKNQNPWILNFPTKEHWKNPSKLDYIEEGLKKFVETYQKKEIISIAFPQLGCANGGLNWGDVQPLMEKYLSNLDIDVEIYIYGS